MSPLSPRAHLWIRLAALLVLAAAAWAPRGAASHGSDAPRVVAVAR